MGFVKIIRLVFLFFLLLPSISQAQPSIENAIKEIDFKDDTIQAVFKYVASTITYDTKFDDSIPDYHSYGEVLMDVLDDNQGVCMHYAALFHAICTRLGFKSYIISGYTKFYNQPVAELPHAWNALRIDDEWFMFDPTWASGYVIGDNFFHHYDPVWYKRSPDEFIYSHIPFDPIWQFRDYVSTHDELAQNIYSGRAMAFNDQDALLKEYDEADEETKLQLSLQRIKKAGLANKLILHKVAFLEKQIAIHQHNRQVYALSAGIELLNSAKLEYNNYLTAKQQLFREWSDNEIAGILKSFEEKLKEAQSHLMTANISDKRLQKYVQQNMQYSKKMLKEAEREEQFVQKYLKTWKPFRFINFL